MTKLFVLFCFLFCVQFVASLKIAAITWNVAETDRETVRNTVVSKIKGKIGSPDIVFVGQQEGPYWSSYKLFSVKSGGELEGYNRVIKSRHCMIFGNCFRSDVYVKNTIDTTDAVEKVLEQGSNYEKVTAILSFKSGGKKYCFANSHFETKYRVEGNHFGHLKYLREKYNDDFNACDFWAWGGDFNFRTNDHTNGKKNEMFTDDLATAYAELDIAGTDNFVIVKNCPSKHIWDKIYTSHVEFTPDVNFPFVVPPWHCIPPTFSKIKMSKCPLRPTGIPKSVDIDDKQPFCLATKSGGSCDGKNMYCLAGDRPPSWTDVIFHNVKVGTTATIEKYGAYYGPSPSDHAPVFIVLEVTHE